VRRVKPVVAGVLITMAATAVLAVLSSPSDLRGDDNNPDVWEAPARAARKKNPIPANADSIAAGRGVYAAQCLSCHGEAGRGDGPAAKDLNPKPRDLSDPKVTAQSDGALFWKLTEGRKPMPSFDQKLTEEQRWQVINYVRTLAKK
jgi:mono/diheme cytochrome c family protein